jgi:hypothetical protein
MSYFNTMDQSLASAYKFTLVYGPEDSHYMQLNGRDYIYISTVATSRMDMFCSTLHEMGHMFAFRQGKDWSDESLAWEIGAKLNKLLDYPIPLPYYNKRVRCSLTLLL